MVRELIPMNVWKDILDITRHEKCKQLQKSIDNLKDMRIIITEQYD